MEALISTLDEILDSIVFDHKKDGTFYNSNIKDHIRKNDSLIYEIRKLLRNKSNLELVKRLIDCNSYEDILKIHLEVDEIAGNHEKRVGEYAEGMANHIEGMDSKTMKNGGYVHDIGKIWIPKDVLYSDFSKNPLNIELTTYGHTIFGETSTLAVDILRKQPIADMISCHHDGKDGYPHHRIENLRDEVECLKIADEFDLQSPDYTKALQIADTAHAMKRGVYQPVYADKEIFDYLINNSRVKGKFNPVFVDAFLKYKGLNERDIKTLRK